MSAQMAGPYCTDYVRGECGCGYSADTEHDYDEVDVPLYSAQLSNQITIRYWNKSDYLVLEHNIDTYQTETLLISLPDYIHLTENVEIINTLLQQAIQGDTLLFKCMLKEGTTITVHSKYAGVRISSPDRPPIMQSDIFIQCHEWNKLISLDLTRKIPEIHFLTMDF